MCYLGVPGTLKVQGQWEPLHDVNPRTFQLVSQGLAQNVQLGLPTLDGLLRQLVATLGRQAGVGKGGHFPGRVLLPRPVLLLRSRQLQSQLLRTSKKYR